MNPFPTFLSDHCSKFNKRNISAICCSRSNFSFFFLSFYMTGQLQVGFRNAPCVLLGDLYLDAIGRCAVVPHGGPAVQCHHSTLILICYRIWDTHCYRHYICHSHTRTIWRRPVVSFTARVRVIDTHWFTMSKFTRTYLCCHPSAWLKEYAYVPFLLLSCWISKGNHIFWSFIGPVCFIILAIVLLFSVTAWKLVQKFNGFNGDPYKLQKIKSVSLFVCVFARMFIVYSCWCGIMCPKLSMGWGLQRLQLEEKCRF